MQLELLISKVFGQIKKSLKYSVGISLVVALLIVPQQAHSQADFSDLFNLIAPPVVKIDALPSGSGSGYIVQYDTPSGEVLTGIITACHVVVNSPRLFGSDNANRQVNVTFGAWRPDITLRAAVVKCDAANDAALLQPISESGSIITLGSYFQDLAIEHNDPSLRAYPRLWLGDSNTVRPLDSVFVMGYPGPFTEFTSVLGRTSGELPLPNIVADNGRVDAVQLLAIYDGSPDRVMDIGDILDLANVPPVGPEGFAGLVQSIFDAGHRVLFLSAVQPQNTELTGWDAVSIEDGVVQVVERPVIVEFSFLFGTDLRIGRPTNLLGSVSLFRDFFKIDAPITGGHSGGPVMNINGQVIGMIEWGVDGAPGANYANTINAIKKAILD
jgi:hypothetical protein